MCSTSAARAISAAATAGLSQSLGSVNDQPLAVRPLGRAAELWPQFFSLSRLLTMLLPCIGLWGIVLPAHGSGIPCWLLCHHPPQFSIPMDVAAHVKDSPYPKLNFFARGVGLFSTYLGKYQGIQGWRGYQWRATVRGIVQQSVSSTDGFKTIDVRAEDILVNGEHLALGNGFFYMRVEVKPCVRRKFRLRNLAGHHVRISGRLMWDGDGFLEIHPALERDIALE